jgi:glycosyltransferase involved in cell wall biosynthesis
MSKSMKVSVIVPVFNGERHLAGALESIFNQSYTDIEIVAVNDGSTDGTAELLRSYDDRITVIHQENRGVSCARNAGVDGATGEFIAFLDQDDVWLSHKLKKQIDVYLRHPGISFIYSDVNIIDNNGKIIEEKGMQSWDLDWIKPFIKGNLPPLPSTVMMKRDLFLSQGGFSSDFIGNAHEDLELWSRLCRVTDFFFIPEPLVQYRKDIMKYVMQGGMRKDISKEQMHEMYVAEDSSHKFQNAITLYNKLYALYGKDREMREPLKGILRMEGRRQSTIGKHFAREGDYKEARKRFQRAWQLDKSMKHVNRYIRTALPRRWCRSLFPA